jgi:hypothetical protein
MFSHRRRGAEVVSETPTTNAVSGHGSQYFDLESRPGRSCPGGKLTLKHAKLASTRVGLVDALLEGGHMRSITMGEAHAGAVGVPV